MGEERNKVSVRIFGEEYTLRGRANPEYIKEIAHYVDAIMQEIKERNPKLASTQVAVLAAVNIADLYFSVRLSEEGRAARARSDGEPGEGEE